MIDILNSIPFTVREIVSLLVKGHYRALEARSKGMRLSAEDMRYAIAEYGRKLIMPPAEAFDNLDIVEVDGTQPRRWSIRVDLWTEDEGRSDLSLEITLIERDHDALDVEIDDIHVL